MNTHPGGTSSAGLRAFQVLGTPLTATSYAEFTDHCARLVAQGTPVAVDFTNTHIVTLRRQHAGFREITSQFDYFIPDGMPLIWCLNVLGARMKDRVYGPTFMRHCLLHSPASITHYFLGGSKACLERLVDAFRRENPGLNLVGSHDGYFRGDEEPAILEEINRLSPDYVWVGLGTPKQQDWIHRHKGRLKRGLVFAVGFAFDVNAGTKPDAPPWMQRLGLTWVFRAASEPRRLVGRYLRFNSLFLSYLLWDGLRGRAFARPGPDLPTRGPCT